MVKILAMIKKFYLSTILLLITVSCSFATGGQYFVQSQSKECEFIVRTIDGFVRFDSAGVTFQTVQVISSKEDPVLGGYFKFPMNAVVHNTKMIFLESNKILPVGADEIPGVTNYLIGRDEQEWKVGLKHFSKLIYRNLYNGIDLVYYFSNGKLKYDYIVSAGVDPECIQVKFLGLKELKTSLNGKEVLISNEVSLVKDQLPLVYQLVNNDTIEVSGKYFQKGDILTFSLGEYNFDFPLVIDPVLNFSTFIGGSADDFQYTGGLSKDNFGNLYETGRTYSNNFPTTPGTIQLNYGGVLDAVVYKLSPNGTTLLYSTYIGGNDVDAGYSTYVEAVTGAVYVGGTTSSSNFPVTTGAYQTSYGGGVYDGFVFKLNSLGTAFNYSTLIGNSQNDLGAGITVDVNGNAWLVGQTNGTFINIGGGYQTTYGGGPWDVILAQVNTTGTALIRTTMFGGAGDDHSHSIQIDPSGNIVFMGFSTGMIPTTPGCYDNTYNGGAWDIYVARINNLLNTLLSSTYIGGSSLDMSWNGLKLDASGNAVVAGYTSSSNFPITNGVFQSTKGSGEDAFLFKLNNTGTQLIASTFFGASGMDEAWGVDLNLSDEPVIVGLHGPNIYYTPCTYDSTLGGVSDAFIAHFNSTFTTVNYSTYIGGSNVDQAYNVLFDGAEYIVAGSTASSTFPVVAGSYDVNYNGSDDFFVFEMGAGPTTTAIAIASIPDTVCAGSQVIFNNSSVNTISSYWDFGDGLFATQNSPSHIYSNPGVYYVSLIAFGSACAVNDTLIDTLVVVAEPNAQINYQISCTGLVQLSCPGNSGSCTWNTGDGTILTGNNVVHQFLTNGPFIIRLVVDNGYCIDSTLSNISIPSQSLAFFTIQDTICGLSVSFNGQNSQASLYSWSFGDGNNSTQQNPFHNYSSPGQYTITLITDSGLCADTISHQVSLFETPDISGVITSDCMLGITPQISILNFDSLQLSTGDGNFYNSVPTYYQYITPGQYIVNVIAFNTEYCSDTSSYTLMVDTLPPALLDYSDTLCSGLIQFNCPTIAQSYSWDFGVAGSQNIQNPAISILNSGWYTVQLITSNGNCRDTASVDFWVSEPPVAQFTIRDSCTLDIDFEFTGVISPLGNIIWDFGDGNTGSGGNISHQYSMPNVYQIVLEVLDTNGCYDSVILDLSVREKAIADFLLVSDSCSSQISVLNNSINSSTYYWDFGDNSYSSLSSPVHEYNLEDAYVITLIADTGLCADTLSYTTFVNIPPVSNFSFSGNCDDSVSFASSVNQGDQVVWLFGDGFSSQIVSPTHVYGNEGDFIASLIVIDSFGCVDSTSQIINVDFSEDLAIKTLVDTCSGTYLFELNNFVSPIAVDFGNGVIQLFDDSVIDHQFPSNGVYSLVFISEYGTTCADSIQLEVDVETSGLQNIWIPNSFTPNDDGKNDVFQIRFSEICGDFNIKIYNRWGQNVFESEKIDFIWDGKFNNSPLPEGVYAFIINGTINLTGYITILR